MSAHYSELSLKTHIRRVLSETKRCILKNFTELSEKLHLRLVVKKWKGFPQNRVWWPSVCRNWWIWNPPHERWDVCSPLWNEGAHSILVKLILTRRQVACKFKHCGRLLACVNDVVPENSVHVAQLGVVADFNTSVENFCHGKKKIGKWSKLPMSSVSDLKKGK